MLSGLVAEKKIGFVMVVWRPFDAAWLESCKAARSVTALPASEYRTTHLLAFFVSICSHLGFAG